MQKGSRVRLTEAEARRMKGNSRHYCEPIDWMNRRGTVVRIGRFNGSISVHWDGRKTLDDRPRRALVVDVY